MNRRASRILTVCAGAWLLVIWGHSCLPAAQSGTESGALLVVVQDLLPRMTDHVLRKCAHFAEYAVLGALTAAALRTSAHFSWPRALLPGPFAALCDETIQLFVPGRSGQIADVWLDTAGYLTGALLTLLIFRLCRKQPKAEKQKPREPVHDTQIPGVIFMPYAFTRQTSAPFSASTTSVSPACRSPERMVRAMSVSAWLCR